jgi:Endopolygalacturonase
MKIKNIYILLIIILGCSCNSNKESNVIIYKAPDGEALNSNYKLTADGKLVPVYIAKIGMERRANRERAMDDQPNSHLFYDVAGFAYFDMKQGPVKIAVSIDKEIKTAKILPTSFRIIPVINGKSLSFEIDKPQHLTVEINGEHIRSLHIFVNPEETDVPDPNDPDVIYFGPGIHEISESLVVGDNKTVYIAGGAIVRCFNVPPPEDPNDVEARRAGRRQSIILSGKNVKVCGRGIVDQENVNRMQSRQCFSVTGEDIQMEGIIIRNSSVWTVSLRGADRVHIDNIKLLGHRANSDGIDICDSWDVLVENCFIRTLDDLIVVKTYNREDGSGRIVARKCVLWNEVAHALSIGAEIQQLVDDVLFTDCDIIGDHCREWSLRVYQCDKGVVKNIRFENIRIEEAVKFASLWINEAQWSRDPERGYIENVVFKDIVVNNPGPLKKEIEFLGFDKEHAVKNVLVQNVVINGKKISKEDIVMNDYVFDVTVLP